MTRPKWHPPGPTESAPRPGQAPRLSRSPRSTPMQECSGPNLEPTISTSRFSRALDVLGLSRPELRAWAMYDWANSAMVCTIITAVFPIYYSKVACAGLEPEVASRMARHRDDDRHGGDRRALSHPGRVRRFHGPEETAARGFPGPGSGLGRRDVLHPHGRLVSGLGAFHPGEHRGQRQLRLLRRTPAPHRPRRRDRSRLDRRLRPGIPRRRAPARSQPRLDPEAGVVRPSLRREPQRVPGDPSRPAGLPLGGRSGGSSSRSPCFAASPSRRPFTEPRGTPGREPHPGQPGTAGRDGCASSAGIARASSCCWPS